MTSSRIHCLDWKVHKGCFEEETQFNLLRKIPLLITDPIFTNLILYDRWITHPTQAKNILSGYWANYSVGNCACIYHSLSVELTTAQGLDSNVVVKRQLINIKVLAKLFVTFSIVEQSTIIRKRMTKDFMIRPTVHCSTKRLEKALSFERKNLDKKCTRFWKKKASSSRTLGLQRGSLSLLSVADWSLGHDNALMQLLPTSTIHWFCIALQVSIALHALIDPLDTTMH